MICRLQPPWSPRVANTGRLLGGWHFQSAFRTISAHRVSVGEIKWLPGAILG